MNKNWNDRADKDLFFTILSVKNIGVISGPEWTTIGNTMRSMGYGFTNEGCRQHFQGLRRAQSKAEASSTPSPALPSVAVDSTKRVDPTQNPITRRPGPGRGRPRKSAVAQEGAGSPATPGLSPAAPAAGAPGVPPVAPRAPMVTGGPDVSGLQIGQQESHPTPSDVPSIPPTAGQTAVHNDPLAMDPSLEDPDEQVAKRPRLDDSQAPSIDPDMAVLSTLAAHNNTTSVESYASEYNYEEA